VLGVLGLVACGEDPPPAVRDRSDAVTDTGKPASQPPPAKSSAAPRSRPPFCSQKPANAGKRPSLPKASSLVATGERELDGALELDQAAAGKKTWTWLNFWAGWCKPCKEEMPLLQGWEKALGGRLRVVFVSVDDDERLSLKFLEEQPKGGVRQSLYFPPNDDRKVAIERLEIGDLTKLPTHVLFDPSGAIRCVASGAIEERDFVAVEKLVGG
jgi:thiol-disulfide isomerase/thioredoxin